MLGVKREAKTSVETHSAAKKEPSSATRKQLEPAKTAASLPPLNVNHLITTVKHHYACENINPE